MPSERWYYNMIDNTVSDQETKNDVEQPETIYNQYLRQLLNHKFIQFFSKDTPTKIAAATALITIGSFLINVLGYMRLKGYLSVFSIAIDGVGYSSNRSFLEFLINAVTFTGLAITVSLAYIIIEFFVQQHKLRRAIYSISKTTTLQKSKRLLSDMITSLPILTAALLAIGLINILLWICMASGKLIFSSTIIEWISVLIILTIIELITAAIFFFVSCMQKRKQIKAKKKAALATKAEKELEDIKKRAISSQKNPVADLITSSAIVLFFLYSASAYLSGILSAQQMKSFPMIEGRYAVIYQDQQRYWTIASQESNTNTLLLNTTIQKIIDANGIELNIKTYHKVTILYE